MNLAKYFSQPGRTQMDLCRKIDAHSADMSRWVTGDRPVPIERCAAIERATGGIVKCEKLRPDVRWSRIADKVWPHPDGRPVVEVSIL